MEPITSLLTLRYTSQVKFPKINNGFLIDDFLMYHTRHLFFSGFKCEPYEINVGYSHPSNGNYAYLEHQLNKMYTYLRRNVV